MTSSPPALEDDAIPVRRSDNLVWEVAAARREAGVTIPKWAVGLGIAALVGLFVAGWPVFVLAVGVILLVVAAQGVRRATDSRHWPTVDAVVTGREIREAQSWEDQQSGSRSTARKTYTPVARYEYVVGGETFQAVSLEDGQASYATLEEAERMVRRDFPTDQPVTVWYAPLAPMTHTRHGADVSRAARRALWPGLLGLVCVVVGVVLLL